MEGALSSVVVGPGHAGAQDMSVSAVSESMLVGPGPAGYVGASKPSVQSLPLEALRVQTEPLAKELRNTICDLAGVLSQGEGQTSISVLIIDSEFDDKRFKKELAHCTHYSDGGALNYVWRDFAPRVSKNLDKFGILLARLCIAGKVKRWDGSQVEQLSRELTGSSMNALDQKLQLHLRDLLDKPRGGNLILSHKGTVLAAGVQVKLDNVGRWLGERNIQGALLERDDNGKVEVLVTGGGGALTHARYVITQSPTATSSASTDQIGGPQNEEKEKEDVQAVLETSQIEVEALCSGKTLAETARRAGFHEVADMLAAAACDAQMARCMEVLVNDPIKYDSLLARLDALVTALGVDKEDDDEKEETEGPPLCSICLVAKANTILTPCHHASFCGDCAQRLRCGPCPLCRRQVEATHQIYFN